MHFSPFISDNRHINSFFFIVKLIAVHPERTIHAHRIHIIYLRENYYWMTYFKKQVLKIKYITTSALIRYIQSKTIQNRRESRHTKFLDFCIYNISPHMRKPYIHCSTACCCCFFYSTAIIYYVAYYVAGVYNMMLSPLN